MRATVRLILQALEIFSPHINISYGSVGQHSDGTQPFVDIAIDLTPRAPKPADHRHLQ